MADVQGERLRAEQELVACEPTEKLTKAQIKRLVLQLKDIVAVLATADPKLKAEVYKELGVSIIYDPDARLVSVHAGPCATERVGEGT
jgi:rRNA-processing protein FCF1